MVSSTVTGNTAGGSGGGIYNLGGIMTLTNSTVSWNTAIMRDNDIVNDTGTLTLTNSTVSGNIGNSGSVTVTNTLIAGDCQNLLGGTITSDGHNVESPGNTCSFDQGTDQAGVTQGQLNLGELADNGGPTETHALLPGSVAIDVIPADVCEATEDQRGFPRDSTCDVGAFEVQP